MNTDRAQTVEKKPWKTVLQGGLAVVGLTLGVLYTVQTQSSATDDPTILEPNAGNVMGSLNPSGRGEFGEIQQ